MKNNFVLFLLICAAPIAVLANESKTIKSKIQSVTVYQQGAQIHRQSYYNVSKGLTVLSIENISRQIDIKSIQVSGTGDVTILDSKHKLHYRSPEKPEHGAPTPKLDKELRLLQDSVTDIEYYLIEVQQKLDILNTQKSILINNGAIKGVGKVNDSIPLLREAMNFYYDKMNLINSEFLALTIRKNKLSKKKNRIVNHIQKINTFKNNQHNHSNINQSPVSMIEITVSANANTSGKIELSYMVNNAGWTPLYDIRSHTKINKIDLTYKAHVYQNTGIDWMNTNLTLSTTNPYGNKTKPSLSPLYVHYYQSQASKAMTDDKKKYVSDGYARDANEEKNLEVVDVAPQSYLESASLENSKNAYDFVKLNQQLISVEYEVKLEYSIPSNNEQHLVLIRQESLKSNYKYYTVPKLDQSAYLVAELTNLDHLNLVPGEAKIFHDGAYIGETQINPNIMADSLALSLGKDQNIQVKRTLLTKDNKTKIIGDKTVKTYAYLFELKNHKSTTTEITLQDQIPVSRTSDIVIEIKELGKGKLSENNGLIDWKLKLKAGETQTIKLIYTVSSIKNKPINLAQL